ncbi:MAG: sugar ABC transporter ATP-binding protein [Caldilinea sp.]|nr:sugar ABC transporter ATP-binding protein [Caldilineaceae bacterium]MCO5212939.1 sugar ABC transporter ATP-binding protein [Caldilinea sp.]MCW5840406.1 sugar ABC transporter ATP-binding protein [Caldilinea sp.]
MNQTGAEILRVEAVSKRYGGVHALEQVNFDLRYGEVHALVGENGAGKSTLIKVLGGIIPRNGGRVLFEGNEVDYQRPIEALHAGIAIIHQELSMMPSLNVIENMYMGRMPGRFGIVNWKDLERRTRQAMALIDLHVDPYAAVQDLTISQRQMIEIARALSVNAKLIIMDEPNSSLTQGESERLFAVIDSLKARGIAIIYVSHKIEEVLRISDRITVFRDGKYVGTVDREDATEQKIINMMVGRELDRTAISVPDKIGDVLLDVRDLSGPGFDKVNFAVRKGEIVAFSGLVGAGRSEVASAIFGARPFTDGEITFYGRPVRFKSPKHAIRAGIAMVQEDRKVLSLFMDMTIQRNITMAELPYMSKGVTSDGAERRLAQQMVRSLDIRLASLDDPVSSLSGGNQQKTVLSRWLATTPKLLILDEPTHGVDVGAKAEIYDLIRKLAAQGVGVMLISSELPEVLALAHRIVVMHEGRITGILDRADASEEALMAYATGIADDFAVPAEVSS